MVNQCDSYPGSTRFFRRQRPKNALLKSGLKMMKIKADPNNNNNTINPTATQALRQQHQHSDSNTSTPTATQAPREQHKHPDSSTSIPTATQAPRQEHKHPDAGTKAALQAPRQERKHPDHLTRKSTREMLKLYGFYSLFLKSTCRE